MNNIRAEIALMIYELKGQELIDALESLSKSHFQEGYEFAMDSLMTPMELCEFD